MLKNYVCKTLSQYCIPGCETLVGKTCNRKTPRNGVPLVQRLSENFSFAVRCYTDLVHILQGYASRQAIRSINR